MSPFAQTRSIAVRATSRLVTAASIGYRFLANRLRRADRRAHRAEVGGLPPRVLGRRASVGIDEVPLLDVGVAQLNQQARVLSLQESSGNSASPELDALARVL